MITAALPGVRVAIAGAGPVPATLSGDPLPITNPMPSRTPEPTPQIQQAITVELTTAGGFPRSTDQIVEALTGQQLPISTRYGPSRVTRSDIHTAVAIMHRHGVIVPARWPGSQTPAHEYWVLPESPWAR